MRSFLILACIIALVAPASAERISHSGPVYLRATTSLHSDCLRILPPGSAVTVLARHGDWLELDAGGVRGFARSRYVGPGSGTPLTPLSSEPDAPPIDHTVSPPVTGTGLKDLQNIIQQTPLGGTLVSQDEDLSFRLSDVRWLHTDVSRWPVTARLRQVKLGGSTITLDYDKAGVWPGRNTAFVNANPWIFVQQDGTWYAATWEWMRHGQTTKNRSSVKGDHIKKAPLQNFTPRSGETYYFMVSGLARFRERNVEERSNIVKLVWP